MADTPKPPASGEDVYGNLPHYIPDNSDRCYCGATNCPVARGTTPSPPEAEDENFADAAVRVEAELKAQIAALRADARVLADAINREAETHGYYAILEPDEAAAVERHRSKP